MFLLELRCEEIKVGPFACIDIPIPGGVLQGDTAQNIRMAMIEVNFPFLFVHSLDLDSGIDDLFCV